jgi:hypothetical protein
MTPTFTINAATELLESDRRKIQKALRNVPPDAKVKGQQQWRIKTILDALDKLPGAVKATTQNNRRSSIGNTHDDGWRDPRIVAATEEVDEAYEALCKLPTLAARRAAAKKLGEKLVINHMSFLRWSVENGNSKELTNYRADQIFFLMLRCLEGPCQWTQHQCRENTTSSGTSTAPIRMTEVTR